MLQNLQVLLFFICPVVESFKKIFMHRLAIDSIIVYCTTIFLNILDKVAHCIEFRVVKVWST